MNKYLVIFYLAIVGAILLIIQIGIRNPWNPVEMVAEREGRAPERKFEWMAQRKAREQKAIETARLTVQGAAVNPAHHVMVKIPAGAFLMGNEKGQNNEQPVRTISLDDYWIDKYEVTMAQFYAFVAATGHREPRLAGYLSIAAVEMASFLEPDKPVVGVSWEDAGAYCR